MNHVSETIPKQNQSNSRPTEITLQLHNYTELGDPGTITIRVKITEESWEQGHLEKYLGSTNKHF